MLKYLDFCWSVRCTEQYGEIVETQVWFSKWQLHNNWRHKRLYKQLGSSHNLCIIILCKQVGIENMALSAKFVVKFVWCGNYSARKLLVHSQPFLLYWSNNWWPVLTIYSQIFFFTYHWDQNHICLCIFSCGKKKYRVRTFQQNNHYPVDKINVNKPTGLCMYPQDYSWFFQ